METMELSPLLQTNVWPLGNLHLDVPCFAINRNVITAGNRTL